MALAYCSSRIVSPDGGGLQTYVENELGTAAGFIVTWMTWCATWVGIPAVALASAGLAQLIPGLGGHLIALSFAIASHPGVDQSPRGEATGDFAIATVLIKVLPMIAVVAIAATLGVRGEPLHPIVFPPLRWVISRRPLRCACSPLPGSNLRCLRSARSLVPSAIWFAR
jgi:APA family basic amino acid/polyamine antiporter